MHKPKAIILDLDNTLWNSSKLINYFPTDETSREGWDNYHKHAHEVTPNKEIVDIVNSLPASWHILVVTSREARGENITKTCELIKKNIQRNNISVFMRPENCYNASVKVKKMIYDVCIKDRYDVQFAIDDELDIFKLWCSFDIPTMLYTQKGGVFGEI